MRSLRDTIRKKKTESPIEEFLYAELVGFGIEPECQYSAGVFFIDFAYPNIKLAIEADGKPYHSSKEKIQKDLFRQKRLEEMGWKFERFDAWFLKRHPKVAAAKIALRYFESQLTKEVKEKALGIIAMFFTSRRDNLGDGIIDNYISSIK